MLRAVSKTVAEKRATGRPVLVGTSSNETAAHISARLNADGIEHDVLAAKNHELEAEIIARAGQPGAVTVLTRMAGRGVDIRLAEPEGEGLYVLGVGPLTSRRLELHLRGRAGRGGDPGESAFFLSFNDPCLRKSERVVRLAGAGTIDEPVGGRLIARSITGMLDGLSASASAHLVRAARYSDVQDEQRAAVYTHRADILENGLQREDANGIIAKTMRNIVLAARRARERGRSRRGAQQPLPDHDHPRCPRDRPDRRRLLEGEDRTRRGGGPRRPRRLRDLDDAYNGLMLRTAAGGDSLTEYQRAASRLAAAMWQSIDEEFVGYWFNLKVELKTD